jgi:hypothetical protein
MSNSYQFEASKENQETAAKRGYSIKSTFFVITVTVVIVLFKKYSGR